MGSGFSYNIRTSLSETTYKIALHYSIHKKA